MTTVHLKEGVNCYHCGDICNDQIINGSGRAFCCIGCKTVYEILNENNLCKYYDLDTAPGISQKNLDTKLKSRFAYLDDPGLSTQLVDFNNGEISLCTFYIPQIHCSSCIWLLENLSKLNSSIIHCEVNFIEKTVSIRFKSNEISLRTLVELLASVGYEPQINLESGEVKAKKFTNKQLYYKIGLAGFCFGNVMLLSFPEYLSIGGLETAYRDIFGYLNILLGAPVLFYSALGYIQSAYNGLKQKHINIDFPIVFGLVVLFIRSVYEIISGTGPGFIDSMTGLIFFLLLGKLFQGKTYDALNFERNYKSYFPIAVTVKKDHNEISIPVSSLKTGNRIIIRNNELIPADSILFNGNANIDYSFVTGESLPVEKVPGEIIYAGGRQTGAAIELEVIRNVSQSYLTSLWNKDAFVKKDENKFRAIVDTIGKYFTFVIIVTAIIAFFYWYPVNLRTALNAFTAVLIIACPCGIALTSPFALGNAVRILGKNKFFAKNSSVVERLANIDTIVFDKTGTITRPGGLEISYEGNKLTVYEQGLVKSLIQNSTHPLSIEISKFIKCDSAFQVEKYTEHSGLGIEGIIDGNDIRIGSAIFAAGQNRVTVIRPLIKSASKVFISVNGKLKGFFTVNNIYRDGFENIASSLKEKYSLFVLSGDNDSEKERLKKYLGNDSVLQFNQSPHQKLKYIEVLQNNGFNVLMTGDGLNDAGALKQSNVGIALTESVTNFLPSCDAIFDASGFSKLGTIMDFSVSVKRIMFLSFAISVIYNILGVMLAFQSEISPLLAAILMPASSITVVLFTVLSTNFIAKVKRLL